MVAVDGFDPSVALPSHDDVAESALGAIVLQGAQVVARERRSQLVKHRVVGTIALALVAGIYILVAQCLAEGLDLLIETIVSHHPGEVQARLALLIPARKQVENDPATKADDGGTLSVSVLHVVDVLGCLHALLFHPVLDGTTEPRHIYQPRKRAEPRDRLLNARFILSRAPPELRHLLERGVGHLCHEDARGQTVLDIVLLEALAHGSVGAQHRPVICHVHHARLCLVGVVVLSPLAMVEAQTIDVILRRPRAGSVGLAKRVEFFSKGVERMPAGVLEPLQERRTRHRHGHHPDQHLRVVGSLLVCLAALLALLPFLLTLACQGILFIELTLPHIDRILTHTLTRSLIATHDGHQPQVLPVAVTIFHPHPVGVGSRDGQHRAEHRYMHRRWNTHERFLQAHGKKPPQAPPKEGMFKCRITISVVLPSFGGVGGGLQCTHNLLHHP